MSGREVSGYKKDFAKALLPLWLTTGFLVVSCAAGNGIAPETVVESAAVQAIAGTQDVVAADVTDYYSRPAVKNPKPGRGLAIIETENFVGSARCAVCHELLTDAMGNDMSISGHWRSTMMANAAKDPLWRAKVSSEVRRNPGLRDIIESKCATCHMPMAWSQAYKEGGTQLIFEPGFISPRHDLQAAAMDGVSCSLCHQIRNENLDRQESFSGKFVIDTSKKAPDREIFGPYEDPVQEVMQKAVGYTPEYGSHINHSALCGICHTLFTPFVDGQGNVKGEFPEQAAYLEWQHSDYNVDFEKRYDIGENTGRGKICQECHMPHSTDGDVYIANWAPPAAEPKDHFSQHHFVGGNVFMLNIMQDSIYPLNISASTEKLADTTERTMRQLQHDTARLALKSLTHRSDELTAVLQVENIAGHKFPTGIPIRRAWLHFTVTNGAGELIFESGKPLADGRIVGNDNDDDITTYEPHYDVINRPEQVQIYEGIMQDTDNEVTYTLLRAATFAKDNRLLPLGFDKSKVPAEIGVYGGAAVDNNFTGGSDLITYRVDTSGHNGPFTVTTELLFTAVSYPFVMDLEKDRELFEVSRFMQLYRQADKLPQELKAIQARVE